MLIHIREVDIVSVEENPRSHVCASNNGTNAGEKGDSLMYPPESADLDPAKNPCLYRKGKDVAIYLTDTKQLCAEVRMVDPRHRMSCMVTFSQPDLMVLDVKSRMEEYPHEVCLEAESSLEVMIGKPVKPGVLQAAAKSIKDTTCTHLVDLFHEACYSVIQARGLYGRQILQELHPDLSVEQITKIALKLMPGLLDSCVAYQSGNNFVKMLENIPFPLNREDLKIFQSLCRSE